MVISDVDSSWKLYEKKNIRVKEIMLLYMKNKKQEQEGKNRFIEPRVVEEGWRC